MAIVVVRQPFPLVALLPAGERQGRQGRRHAKPAGLRGLRAGPRSPRWSPRMTVTKGGLWVTLDRDGRTAARRDGVMQLTMTSTITMIMMTVTVGTYRCRPGEVNGEN